MKERPYRRLAGVWLALMALLALTCASAFVPLGLGNTVLNFAVAAIKALLVAVFFMHFATRPIYRVVALAALFILSLLLGLSLADYGTRAQESAPWQVPHGGESPRDVQDAGIQRSDRVSRREFPDAQRVFIIGYSYHGLDGLRGYVICKQ